MTPPRRRAAGCLAAALAALGSPSQAAPPAPLRLPIHDGGRLGYVDARGRLVIPALYDRADGFADGVAIVGRDGRFGLIDARGRARIPLTFVDAGSRVRGLVALRGEAGWGLFRVADGAEVVAPTCRWLWWVDEERRWSCGRAAKEEVRYDAQGRMVDPRAPGAPHGVPAADGDHALVVDGDGRAIVPTSWARVLDVADGMVGVVDDRGRCGYVDARARATLAPAYATCLPFSDGHAAVEVDGRWGFIDRAGRPTVPPAYAEAGPWRRGRGLVRAARGWTTIDAAGRTNPNLACEALSRDPASDLLVGTCADRVVFLDDDGHALGGEAVVTRHDLEAATRRLEVAWGAADAPARARALPWVRAAVDHFFAARPYAALAALADGTLALASAAPPTPAARAAAMAVVHLPDDLGTGPAPRLAVACPTYLPPGGGAAPRVRAVAGTAPPRASRVATLTRPCTAVTLEQEGSPGEAAPGELVVTVGDAPATRRRVATAPAAALPTAEDLERHGAGAPPLERATLRAYLAQLVDPAWRPPWGVTRADRAAELARGLAAWQAGGRWFTGAPGTWTLHGERELLLEVPARRAARAPLVVALQGDGATPSWWFELYGAGALRDAARARGFYLIAADTDGGQAAVDEALAAARALLPDVDWARVYLVGHSRGGRLALEAAGAARAAGVAALSPGPEVATPPPATLPTFVGVAEFDLPHISRAVAATVQAMRAAGARHLEVRTLPGVEHYLVVGASLGAALDFLLGPASPPG